MVMSIQARMKDYPIKTKTVEQDRFGQKIETWADDGSFRAVFHQSPPEIIEAQGVQYREHESFLVTMEKNRVSKGVHAVIVDGDLYEVLDDCQSNGRYHRIVVKAMKEGNV